VQQVRLVYCDAQPYDEGFVDVQALATRARVRGRGGTVLQPALTLLETRVDFPKDGPILVITDGLCESELTLHRDHAFLLAPGGPVAISHRQAGVPDAVTPGGWPVPPCKHNGRHRAGTGRRRPHFRGIVRAWHPDS
jgi:hypothetical protein